MSAVSLTSRWFIQPGLEGVVLPALIQLAAQVQADEPDTLTYLVHFPFVADIRLQSLPPPDPLMVLFFETYASPDAFLAHVDGPTFTSFVAEYGQCFVQAGGKPYTTVQFLDFLAGFAGRETSSAAPAEAEIVANQHPAVMFEVIAQNAPAAQAFYRQVFGWRYQTDASGFAYIHFPAGAPPLLGGIGQAQPGQPGFEPGHNFYLLVDALEPVLERVLAAGGSALMPPTQIDGYRFAMFHDPEGNPVGIIEPFSH
jgi:predicted enzyme related to lactoylglutathione lyase/quinol monooxygenase YgiN